MGVPYPEAELEDAPRMASGRRQKRWERARLMRRIINVMVSSYSYYLALCSPPPGLAVEMLRAGSPGHSGGPSGSRGRGFDMLAAQQGVCLLLAAVAWSWKRF